MDKRISKSFKSIFKNFYPNLDETDANKALDYFLFTLQKFPDKSNILQLKLFLFVFSFSLRKIFIKDKKNVTVKELQKKVWDYSSDLDTHTVETHIYRLRKKMKETFGNENFILNTSNGYSID